MERTSACATPGIACTTSEKSSTPKAGADGASPWRVLSRTRRCSTIAATSSPGGDEVATRESSPRPLMPSDPGGARGRRRRLPPCPPPSRSPLVGVLHAALLVPPDDLLEDELDRLHRREASGLLRDGVVDALLHGGDVPLLELHRVELLGAAVVRGVGSVELEDRLDLLVLGQRLHDERRRLIDPLHDPDRLVLAPASDRVGALLAGRLHGLLVRHALDRSLPTHARLRALPLDVLAVRLQEQMNRLSHVVLP